MASTKGHLKATIEKEIREIVSFELKNPRLGFVCINEVEMNVDYSLVRVYVSFLGAKYPTNNFKELESLTGVVRSKLASKVKMRKVPEVRFVLDKRFYLEDRINKALAKEEEDLANMSKKEN